MGVNMNNDTCTVDNCDKPVKRKSLCYGHYMKAWRYGTPTPTFDPKWVDLRGVRFGALVVRERDGLAWVCDCDCGRTTVTRAGDLNRGSAISCGDRATHSRADHIGYGAAHDRCRSDRGLPSDHECVGCGRPAQHWSYDHTDPDELISDSRWSAGIAYSTNPDHYSPRCVPCHKAFDLGRINATRY